MEKYTISRSGQELSGRLVYYHLKTVIPILPSYNEDLEYEKFMNQARVWERIIEIIRNRVGIVAIGYLDKRGFSFITEHSLSVNVSDLEKDIREIGVVPFGGTTESVDLSNVVLVSSDELRVEPNLNFYQPVFSYPTENITSLYEDEDIKIEPYDPTLGYGDLVSVRWEASKSRNFNSPISVNKTVEPESINVRQFGLEMTTSYYVRSLIETNDISSEWSEPIVVSTDIYKSVVDQWTNTILNNLT